MKSCLTSERRVRHVAKHALENDGWTITHDLLEIGEKRLYADLGANRLLSANKGIEKIAVEIKSFLGHSALGALNGNASPIVLFCFLTV